MKIVYTFFRIFVIFCLFVGTTAAVDLPNSEQIEAQLKNLQVQVDQLKKQVQQLKEEQSKSLLYKSPVSGQSVTSSTPKQNTTQMEKCRVVDKDGNGLIKPYMADSGSNLEGDRNAWIWVPFGQCQKINKGDFTGVPEEILYKIHDTHIQPSSTYK